MKRQLVSTLLLVALAVAARAGEAPVPDSDEPAAARPAGLGETVKIQFGTRFTDQVMSDVSARVTDDLEVRLEREVGAEANVGKYREDKLLVSSH